MRSVKPRGPSEAAPPSIPPRESSSKLSAQEMEQARAMGHKLATLGWAMDARAREQSEGKKVIKGEEMKQVRRPGKETPPAAQPMRGRSAEAQAMAKDRSLPRGLGAPSAAPGNPAQTRPEMPEQKRKERPMDLQPMDPGIRQKPRRPV